MAAIQAELNAQMQVQSAQLDLMKILDCKYLASDLVLVDDTEITLNIFVNLYVQEPCNYGSGGSDFGRKMNYLAIYQLKSDKD